MKASIDGMLRDIHGLLHEARSNVELPLHEGQLLLDSVAAARNGHQQGTMAVSGLAALIGDLRKGIGPSIEKEASIDNPEAAVFQIQEILERLQRVI